MTLISIHFTVLAAANFGGAVLHALSQTMQGSVLPASFLLLINTFCIRRPRARCLVTITTNYVWRGLPFVHAPFWRVHQTHRILSLRVSHPLTTATSVTGYALAFCLIPAHFIRHLALADPAAPISSPSLSKLDNAKAMLSGCSRPSVVLCSSGLPCMLHV
jgi:hypothetical protein